MVEGEGGKRVAIQCDGDRRQPAEALPEVMERQLTLERLGWKFIRLRASEFFRDPEAGLKKLFGRLKEAGIAAIGPVTAEETANTNRGEELKKKVLQRAQMIKTRWKNIPDVPTGAPTKPAMDETEDEEEQEEEAKEAA